MDAVDQAIEDIRARLAAAKAAIKAELKRYPQPITACDAQYNHLSDARRQLTAEIARLDEIAKAGVPQNREAAIAAFLDASPHVDEAAADEIRAAIRAALPR